MITLINIETRLITSIKTLLIASLLECLFFNCVFAEEIIAPPRISLDQATKQIIKRDSNIRVLGAETEIFESKLVHVIKALTPDGRIQHYKIDAETGEIITKH